MKPTQSRKRVKGRCPLRSPEAAPLVGFGATPQPFRGRPVCQTRSTKGAGSEASLPVTLRVLRRAPKLLFPSTQHCRARWARPTSMGEGFLSMLVFFIAGISPLRRRQGGFPIAPLTPSAPPLLGLSAAGFVRGKGIPLPECFLPNKSPGSWWTIVLVCCRGCYAVGKCVTPARTASCTARRRSRPFAADPRACRIR